MSIKVNQYWVKGPPPGIFDGLLTSGLVSKSSTLPSVPSKPQPIDQNNRPVKTNSNSHSRKVANSPPKIQRPNSRVAGKTIIPKTTSVSTEVTIKGRYKPPSLTGNVENTSELLKQIRNERTGLVFTEDDEDEDEDQPEYFSEFIKYANDIRYNGRCEGKDLIRELEEKIQEDRIDEYETATTEGKQEILSNLMNSYDYIWKKFILLLQSYNQDYAILCQRIKIFIDELLVDQIPGLQARYQQDLEMVRQAYQESDQRYQESQKTVKDLEDKIRALQNSNSQINQSSKATANKMNRLKHDNADLLYQLDLQKTKTEEALVKVTKLEQSHENLNNEIKTRDQIIRSTQENNTKQDELIRSYEEEGASYKSLYNKVSIELQETKDRIRDLEKAQTLRSIPIRNISTEPIFEIKEKNDEPKVQKNKTILQFQSSPESIDIKPQSLSLSQSESFEVLAEVKFISRSGSKSNVTSTRNSALPSTYRQETEEEDFHFSIENYDTEESIESEEKGINYDLIKLPDDYDPLTKHIQQNKSYSQFVSQLFLQPPNEEFSPSSLPENGMKKSFQWTLQQAVSVLKDGYNSSCTSSIYDIGEDSKSFSGIMKQVFLQMGNSIKLLDKVYKDFITSINEYKNQSKTCTFLLKFFNNEYSLSDFKFFSILFSTSYQTIYPPVSTILDDQIIENDDNLFLIHPMFFNSLAHFLFHIHGFPEHSRNILIPDKEKPSLVNFWSFSEEMIKLFHEQHERFHNHINDIFQIIGYNKGDQFSGIQFRDTIRFILPNKQMSEIHKLWKDFSKSFNKKNKDVKNEQFVYQKGQNNNVEEIPISTNNDVVNFDAFIQFCKQMNEIPSSIMDIQGINDFNEKFSNITVPQQTLFNFLKQRYCEFIPKITKSIPNQIKPKIDSFCIKMRNAFMCCNISSALNCYSSLLQFMDLKMTEINSFLSSADDNNADSVNEILEYLKMREILASLCFTDQGNKTDGHNDKNDDQHFEMNLQALIN